MSFELQEGIYYRSKPPIGNSFCVVSLKSENNSQIDYIGNAVARIWSRLIKLKNGIVRDLNISPRLRKKGNLTVLVGYGAKLFEIPGSKKVKPTTFSENWNFKSPSPNGGGSIIEGSELKYSAKIIDNHLLFDHIIFQFIADTAFYTTRAAVEVWKELHEIEKETGHSPLRITGLYTGFQRADQRNWQGFHDGVSNLKSRERPFVISIDSRYLSPQDKWVLHGTYLAFIRIAINLEKWEDTDIRNQEILIGRDKLTGCPLIRVDESGRPIKDARCPVPGTSEVIERGNEYFRNYSPSNSRSGKDILDYSHIGRSRSADRVPVLDKKSFRIFRQGFEFLVASDERPGFIAGLNFVSFQNTPERLFKILTYHKPIGPKPYRSAPSTNFDQFLSVYAAGIFLVPPVVKNELFPGARLFFSDNELRYLPKSL
jgi:Dyp-type peroxidase family